MRIDRRRREQRWDDVGATLTAMAMGSQSLFGGLLMDELIQDQELFWRAVGVALVVAAAFTGKYRIVRFFNHQSFKDLAKGNPIEARWLRSPSAWLNTIMTLNMACVFGLLSNQSFDDSAAKLREWDSEYANRMAEVITHPLLQMGFAGASFFANLLTFPGLHVDAFNQTRENVKRALLTPESRGRVEKREAVLREIRDRAAMIVRQHLSEPQHVPCAPFDPELVAVREGRVILLKEADAPMQAARTDHSYSRRERGLRNALEITMIGVTVWGLYNFCNMWSIFREGQFHSDGPATPVESVLSDIAGGMSWLSMAAMALMATPPLARRIADTISGRTHEVVEAPVAWHYPWAFLVCLVGAAPNVYISQFEDNEPIMNAVPALFAPIFLELCGYVAMLRLPKETQRCRDGGDRDFWSAAYGLQGAIERDRTCDEVASPDAPIRYRGFFADNVGRPPETEPLTVSVSAS